jgi:hypothetical protein
VKERPKKHWTTIAGFAEHMQISPATVRRRIAQGLPVVRDGGIVRIPIDEAEQWLMCPRADAAEPNQSETVTAMPAPVIVCEVLQ